MTDADYIRAQFERCRTEHQAVEVHMRLQQYYDYVYNIGIIDNQTLMQAYKALGAYVDNYNKGAVV